MSLIRSLGLLSAANALQAVARLAAFLIAARVVLPAEFGPVALATVVINVLQHVFRAGLHVTVVQLEQLESDRLSALSGLAIVLAIAAVGVLEVVRPLADSALGVSGVEQVLLPFALLLAFQVFGAVPEGLALRERRYGDMFVAELCASAVQFTVLLAMLWRGSGVDAVVWATIADYLARTAVLWWRGRLPMPSLPRSAELRTALEGSSISFGAIANEIALRADYVIVGANLGPAAVGTYERSYQFLSATSVLLGQPVERLVFSRGARGGSAASREVFERLTGRLVLVLAPLGVSLAMLLPAVLGHVLGESWVDVGPPLAILLTVMFARVGYRVADGFALSLGINRFRGLALACYALLVVAGSALGVRFGLSGVAVGVAAAVTSYYFIVLLRVGAELGSGWFAVARLHIPGLLASGCVVTAGLLWKRLGGAMPWFGLAASMMVLGVGVAGLVRRGIGKEFA